MVLLLLIISCLSSRPARVLQPAPRHHIQPELAAEALRRPARVLQPAPRHHIQPDLAAEALRRPARV